MARLLILLSLLTISSFALAQNTRLKAELIITGEIVEDSCQTKPYQKIKGDRRSYKTHDLFNNCKLANGQMELTSKVSLKKKVISTKNNSSQERLANRSSQQMADIKKGKHNRPQQDVVLYIAEYR